MKKRKLIFILLVIAVVMGLGLFAYFKLYKTRVVSPVTDLQPTPYLYEELATWVDQSEFSFQYPKSLKLDPHEEDQENYAHVELTSATHSGNLIVWAKDTMAEDITAWAKQTKAIGAIDSTLGGVPAKKILTKDGTQILTVTTIRDGYLYQIETKLTDPNYWNKVYETVISTFKFVEDGEKLKNKNDVDSSSSDDSGVGSDEFSGDEEVIE